MDQLEAAYATAHALLRDRLQEVAAREQAVAEAEERRLGRDRESARLRTAVEKDAARLHAQLAQLAARERRVAEAEEALAAREAAVAAAEAEAQRRLDDADAAHARLRAKVDEAAAHRAGMASRLQAAAAERERFTQQLVSAQAQAAPPHGAPPGPRGTHAPPPLMVLQPHPYVVPPPGQPGAQPPPGQPGQFLPYPFVLAPVGPGQQTGAFLPPLPGQQGEHPHPQQQQQEQQHGGEPPSVGPPAAAPPQPVLVRWQGPPPPGQPGAPQLQWQFGGQPLAHFGPITPPQQLPTGLQPAPGPPAQPPQAFQQQQQMAEAGQPQGAPQQSMSPPSPQAGQPQGTARHNLPPPSPQAGQPWQQPAAAAGGWHAQPPAPPGLAPEAAAQPAAEQHRSWADEEEGEQAEAQEGGSVQRGEPAARQDAHQSGQYSQQFQKRQWKKPKAQYSGSAQPYGKPPQPPHAGAGRGAAHAAGQEPGAQHKRYAQAAPQGRGGYAGRGRGAGRYGKPAGRGYGRYGQRRQLDDDYSAYPDDSAAATAEHSSNSEDGGADLDCAVRLLAAEAAAGGAP